MTTHLVIPDTQVRPGVPIDHLRWIGRYILDRRPDVVVHLGDNWDMPSLSSYDRGKGAMEGRRYVEDVKAGNEGLALLTAPTRKHNARLRTVSPYLPRWVLLRGNHENRIQRAIDDNVQLDGAIGFDDLLSPGWEVHDFLVPVFIDGVCYSHFLANPMTGKPIGGMIETRLKTVGHTFIMGHQQTLLVGARYVHGANGPQQQRGVVAGACYLHEESYKGPQGNAHWRGVLVCHEVRDGAFDLMEVSLDYLCRRYEGVDLADFLASDRVRLA